jgi:hypothetical protein
VPENADLVAFVSCLNAEGQVRHVLHVQVVGTFFYVVGILIALLANV